MTIISQNKDPHDFRSIFFGRLMGPIFNETIFSYTLTGSNIIFRISIEGKKQNQNFNSGV